MKRFDPKEFQRLRLMAREILLNPLSRDWSVQGFGMLRTYLDNNKQFRLNIWDKRRMVMGVSTIHDHPWHFESVVIGGHFTNVRYAVGTIVYDGYAQHAMHPNYHCQMIRTGEGGGPIGEPTKVFLHSLQPEVYEEGDNYSQHRAEVHASFYADGAVTLNNRTHREGEDARVFWPLGERWVDAEPRSATPTEIIDTCDLALQRWFRLPADPGRMRDIVGTCPPMGLDTEQPRITWPIAAETMDRLTA